MKVVVPGISGAIGRKLATLLLEAGHEVIGIDARPWHNAPDAIELHHADIRKRSAEDVFRRRRPDAVVHLATVTSLTMAGEERGKINLGGTRAVFDYAREHGVKHVIFVGRHTFYGTGPDAPLFHTEDEPPLGLGTFPELADLVAADLFAGTALWRFPELVTTVLRVCYTLGPSGHGTLAGFLRPPRIPTVMGFDPLFQFMHETDVATAVVRTLDARPRGVFNVAGPSPVPLSVIIRECGRRQFPIPEFLLASALGRFGLPKLSRGALSHIKYPVVVDAEAFQRATGFKYRYSESETIAAFREAFPPAIST